MTIRSPHRAGPRRDNGPKINTAITAAEVRVLDEEGEMRGVMSVADAILLAEEVGLDLVEMSPNAEPPVCKILDYSKYKFQQQKKANEARKKQKTVDVKEVKIRPGIERHDYDVKMRNARRFLEAGNKVKVTMRFRGREMAHQELGMEMMKRVEADLTELAQVEQYPKMEGRQMTMVLAPRSKKK